MSISKHGLPNSALLMQSGEVLTRECKYVLYLRKYLLRKYQLFTSRLLIEDKTLDFSAIEIAHLFNYYYLFGYEILAINHFCLSVTFLICPVVTSKCDSRDIQNKCSFYPKIYSKQLNCVHEISLWKLKIART